MTDERKRWWLCRSCGFVGKPEAHWVAWDEGSDCLTVDFIQVVPEQDLLDAERRLAEERAKAYLCEDANCRRIHWENP